MSDHPDPAFWWNWPVQVAIAVGTIGAVLVALFGDWIKAIFANLTIRIEAPAGVHTPINIPPLVQGGSVITSDARYFQLRVSNNRKHFPAHRVSVYLLHLREVSDDGAVTGSWDGEIPLIWQHQDFFPGPRTIGNPANADLFRVAATGALTLQPAIGALNLPTEWKRPVELVLTVQARSDETNSPLYTVRVHWNGMWATTDEDVESKVEFAIVSEQKRKSGRRAWIPSAAAQQPEQGEHGRPSSGPLPGTRWSRILVRLKWVLSLQLLLFTVIAVAGAMVYAFWPPLSDVHMARAGVALQVIAGAMGYIAIWRTRQLFGLSSLRQEFRWFLDRRPRFRTHTALSAALRGRSSSMRGGAELSTYDGMGADLSLEKRVNALVENFSRLRQATEAASFKNKGAIEQLRTDTEAKLRSLDSGLSGEARLLRQGQTDGLWMAAAALTLLLFGTALAGIPSLLKAPEPTRNVAAEGMRLLP